MNKIKGIFAVGAAIIIGILSYFFSSPNVAANEKNLHKTSKDATAINNADVITAPSTTQEKALADIPELSTDYPKRPLQKGENMPFNRPALE